MKEETELAETPQPIEYARQEPTSVRGMVMFVFLKFSAVAIMVVAGLRFWYYMVAWVMLISSNASRGTVGNAFTQAIAAAVPFALGGILYLLNEIALPRLRGDRSAV